MPSTSGLFRRKSIEESLSSIEEPDRHLKRDLSAWDLAVLGVAVALGAGIFSVGATASANYAGPSVILSFILASAVCALAVMCYAEFASALPVSGSAYTFSYVTMGELAAWIIGWDLILEMLLAAAVIAKFWGVYLSNAFGLFGIKVSTTLHLGPVDLEWPPVLVVAVFTVLLAIGTKLSTRISSVFTVIKVGITLFVIVVGFFYVKAANFSPFIPPSVDASGTASSLHQPLVGFLAGFHPSTYGVMGMLSAAGLVFFAFIGFDVVATTAEEAKDPQRTVPRGILGGLGIVTILYILVTLVVTGMVRYDRIGPAAVEQAKEAGRVDYQNATPSLTTAFTEVGATWAGKVISIGILIGLTTVIMVMLLGLTRVAFAMSRDGLLPRAISRTSDRHHTPIRLQIGAGVLVALIGGLSKVDVLEEMINIGTLSAFVLVSFGIPVLRRSRPDLKRPFQVPFSPALPILAGVACIWLMTNLAVKTWLFFLVWVAIGLVFYFSYGRRHSLLAHPTATPAPDPTIPPSAPTQPTAT